MLSEFFQAPSKNSDMVPLIDKRLSGESFEGRDIDTHGKAA
jgi:hypothetical protein